MSVCVTNFFFFFALYFKVLLKQYFTVMYAVFYTFLSPSLYVYFVCTVYPYATTEWPETINEILFVQ